MNNPVSNALLNVSVRELIDHLKNCGLTVGLHPWLEKSGQEELEQRLVDALQPVARILLPGDSDVTVVVHTRGQDKPGTPGGSAPYDPLKGQVGGSHYKGMKIQHAEFCQLNQIPWCESAAIKYLCRHKDKNGVQDVDKAIHYCLIARKLEYPEAPPFQLPGK